MLMCGRWLRGHRRKTYYYQQMVSLCPDAGARPFRLSPASVVTVGSDVDTALASTIDSFIEIFLFVQMQFISTTENLSKRDPMQYDPLVEILNVAENSVEHLGKSAAIRNLQSVLKADPNLSKELQKRMAAVLRDVPPVPLPPN